MSAYLPLLLAANWDEIISFLVGAVVLVFWLIGQIQQARKQPGPGAGPPAEPVPPAPPADPLRAQIDEFLRRVQQAHPAGGRDPAVRGETPPPPVHEEVVVLLEEAPTSGRHVPQAPALRPVPEAQAKQPAPPGRRPRRGKAAAAPLGKGVAEHVAETLAGTTQKFREEVAHLGERVKHADEQFDAQLQQKFDHELSTLSGSRTATAYDQQAVVSDSPAARIAAMLTTPEGAQQAIVLNEILRRPEERW